MFWPAEEITKVPYKSNFFLVEPFGQHLMFKVRLERGETPGYFDGRMYTTVDKAVEAIKLFVQGSDKPKTKE